MCNLNIDPRITFTPIALSAKELHYHRFFMDNAIRASEMSHCSRKKVGALIVNDGHIISTGWNGMPSNMTNVCELPQRGPNGELITNPLVRHAERNALERFIGRSECSCGASMYVTTSPCLDCAITSHTRAKLANVYFYEFYRSADGIVYLLTNDVPVFQFTGEELFRCLLT